MNNSLVKTILIVTIFACGTVLNSYGAFKDMGWGARPVSMGGAYTAVSDDANAVIYNPAGMVQIANVDSTFMYAKLFAGLDEVDMGLNYLAFAAPMGPYGTVGCSWASFVSKGEYQEDAFIASYARWLNSFLAGGISIKYLGHKYTLDGRSVNDPVFAGGDSKYAVTADIGLFGGAAVRGLPNPVMAGLSIKNLTQPDIGLKSEDKVPMEATAGASYEIKPGLKVAGDLSYRLQEWGKSSDKMNVRLGGEMWLMNRMLGIRAGGNFSDICLGLGFSYPMNTVELQFDYGFVYPMQVSQTQGTHRLSLSLRYLLPKAQ